MQVPQKAKGKFYAVVLRNADFSYANVARQGALGGDDVIPIPVLGTECVCCNADARGHTVPFSLTDATENFTAEPLDVPVCTECTEHAAERTGASVMAAIGLCTGIPAAVLGFVYDWGMVAGVAGLVITAVAIAWILRERMRRQDGTLNGHHPGASIMASPRQCVVRTTNRALAERVVERNASRVHRVR